MSGDDDFEKMMKNIQSKINQDEEQDYSKTVINEYRNPSNFGIINNPDVLGEIKGSCGDTMKISLNIENKKVKKACFWTDGCGASIACGSMLTKMIKGESIDAVLAITSKQLVEMLGGLPKEHLHCAVLAVNTLYKAIEKYDK